MKKRRSLPKPFDSQEISGLQEFITPEGEAIALEDVDKMCAYLGSVYDNTGKLQEVMEALAMECIGHKMHAAACGWFARGWCFSKMRRLRPIVF